MNPDIRKYPRTQHVRGSRLQHGDHDLTDVPFEDLSGKHLVVEEKVDGANCGVSFSATGQLLLQSRGHYLHGGPREKQFELLKQWSCTKQGELSRVLGTRYVLYGEWLFAKHTVYYDALPHYFMEFDVLDTDDDTFLSTDRRHELLAPLNLWHAKVLAAGQFGGLSELASLVKRSNFITDERILNLNNAAELAGVAATEAWRHTDRSELMEGLYLKWEEDGEVKGRYKYVRNSFTNSIMDQESHWHDRPIVQNGLALGAMEGLFT